MSARRSSVLPHIRKSILNPRISIFGIICIGFFVLNSVILRFLLPLGDEPDYLYRLAQLSDASRQPFWSPYVLKADWVAAILGVPSPTCQMSSWPLKITARIDPQTCTEPLMSGIIRIALVLLLSVPLFIFACVRFGTPKASSETQATFARTRDNHWQTALALALTFPAMVYYLGLLSVEQFVLVLCLLAVLAWRSFSLQIFLLILAASLDFGNSIVAVSFVIFARVALALEAHLTPKVVVSALLGLVAATYTLGFYMLSLVAMIPALSGKSNAIYASMQGNINVEKYPIVFRPVITYLNFVFSTPASLKVPIAYLAVSFALVVCVKRSRALFRRLRKEGRTKDLSDMRHEAILSLCGLSLILIFVFAAPTYANAKYYIFLLPIFLLIPIRVFGRERVLVFSQLIAILVVMQLLYFRIVS